ncbi:hypothetical protein MCUN1_003416 [Malassezia cuniculi]|uniref:Sphingomyelin phosphodiesterase n=1 Tax=Malassezia cuniculi TaxID=948313 RepID=A0AAF0F1I1_9BASI|nr:hypothetical protein MCUN1_003416 [Malassezia cuniculi]
MFRLTSCTALAVSLTVSLALALAGSADAANATTTTRGPAVFTAPTAFPTSLFASMQWVPQSQEGQPQPFVRPHDSSAFPETITNPNALPTAPPESEAVMPKPSAAAHAAVKDKNAFRAAALKNITGIIDDKSKSKCSRCISALRVGQHVARAEPELVPGLLVDLCKRYKYQDKPDVKTACEKMYQRSVWGGPYAQVLSFADFSHGAPDAQNICALALEDSFCDVPEMDVLSDEFLDKWFNGQRTEPKHVTKRSRKTGETRKRPLRVLHLSDIHVDPRYAVGGEVDCDSGQCCRSNSWSADKWDGSPFAPGDLPKANLSKAAGYWGSAKCDSPWALVGSAMQALQHIEGADPIELGVFTGDLATHDRDWQVSRDLVKYAEIALYTLLKDTLGNMTMVVTLGNHDTAPADFFAPHNLPDGLGDQMSWNWDTVAQTLESVGWVNSTDADKVRKHFGGYSTSPRKGLRVISLNGDYYFRENPFAYVHLANPDFSGQLRWLTDELQAAEDAHERVWIISHEETGYSGEDALDNPTNLINHIITRYASTIAHIFFGHTHEDQFQVFYSATSGNSTAVSRKTEDAVAAALMGPSVSPGRYVNPGVRVYVVDPQTYEVLDYDQYYTQLDEFDDELKNAAHGPVWHKLYNARATYGNLSASEAAGTYRAPVQLDNGWWPKDAPLNASFWAALTDEMEQRPELVTLHSIYQARNSKKTVVCDSDECVKATICYMRSGTSALGRACQSGFGSVVN